MKLPRDFRFFFAWAALFVAGLLVMNAGGGWAALGALIVMPTILTAALMAYGYVIYKFVQWFGGDPDRSDTFGLWVFVSFALLILPILIALYGRHR
jgi:hypothetical protein